MTEPYDIKHEASAATNELFFRHGPEAKDIKRTEAWLVSGVIEFYMRAAASAMTLERDKARAELSALQGGIDGVVSMLKLQQQMYNNSTQPNEKVMALGIAVALLSLEKLTTWAK